MNVFPRGTRHSKKSSQMNVVAQGLLYAHEFVCFPLNLLSSDVFPKKIYKADTSCFVLFFAASIKVFGTPTRSKTLMKLTWFVTVFIYFTSFSRTKWDQRDFISSNLLLIINEKANCAMGNLKTIGPVSDMQLSNASCSCTSVCDSILFEWHVSVAVPSDF